MDNIIYFIVDTVGALGYFGIFAMMFLEASFFPFPSEVVMIPAGYLVYKGDMNMVIALLAGAAGSLAGGLFNYWLALFFGRAFLIRYGRYFFFSEDTMNKMDRYFTAHGDISTFLGRLIPVVRQYISLPAGLAKMNLLKFCIYTTLGATIWIAILAIFGYWVGMVFGDDLSISNIIDVFTSKITDTIGIKDYMKYIVLATLGAVVLIALAYICIYRHKHKSTIDKQDDIS